jgi:predicted enzyme related to lactoylglutathione lyase
MQVEQLKYIIWAQDLKRAVAFYRRVFEAEVVRESDVMAEIRVAGSLIGLHGGGEGNRTWTGLAFQVRDLAAACAEFRAAGGTVFSSLQDTAEEPAHLAMCMDPEGNEIMLTVPRR